MTNPKGGRGKKATYKTVVVRIPEPLLLAVQKMVSEFHQGKAIENPQEYTPLHFTDIAVDFQKSIFTE